MTRKTHTQEPGLQLSIHATTGQAFVPFLRRYLLAAHAILRPALDQLSVALVGDKRMSLLHEQFMGISGPTDVLTFPLEHDKRGRVIEGEVVICVPEARRRVKGSPEHGRQRRDRTPAARQIQQELLLYALHGMLHLSGFDDKTESAYRIMHRREDDILTQLGIGRLFAGGDDRAGESHDKRGIPRRGHSTRAAGKMDGKATGGS